MTAENWEETNKGLYRKFEFDDFNQAFNFMTRVARLAELAEHHPTWTNTYGEVEIWLISHEAGDIITDEDRTMAAAINGVVRV
jgi:4a-hydroxytetrahydrobiopterin dehydratase